MEQRNIAAIVLAAGQSKRYGSNKLLQRLPNGRSLLTNTVETALAAGCSPVLVVTGAFRDEVQHELATHKVEWVHNENWAQGMGTSIAAAARNLLNRQNHPDAAFLLVSDQPLLQVALLRKMKRLYEDHSPPAIWCDYGQAFGPPVLFDFSLMETLSGLQGHQGAKSILKKLHDQVLTVPFPEGKYDIDHPGDWKTVEP